MENRIKDQDGGVLNGQISAGIVMPSLLFGSHLMRPHGDKRGVCANRVCCWTLLSPPPHCSNLSLTSQTKWRLSITIDWKDSGKMEEAFSKE